MPVVSARLGDYVYYSAQRPAVLRSKAVVHDAELADRLLRGRGSLGRGHRINVVRAINRHNIAQVAHAPKRDSRDFELGESGLQARPACGNTRGQESKVGEQAAANGQRLDLFPVDYLADLGSRGLNWGGFAGHRYLSRDSGSFQGDVHCRGLADATHDAGRGEGRKAAV